MENIALHVILREIRLAKIGVFYCQVLVASIYILCGRNEVYFWLCRIYTLYMIFITCNTNNLGNMLIH